MKQQGGRSKQIRSSAIPESSKREANLERLGDHSDSCIVCGKRTKATLFIHMTTDGQMVDEGDEKKVENSQGFFPIGPDCARQIEKAFIFPIK